MALQGSGEAFQDAAEATVRQDSDEPTDLQQPGGRPAAEDAEGQGSESSSTLATAPDPFLVGGGEAAVDTQQDLAGLGAGLPDLAVDLGQPPEPLAAEGSTAMCCPPHWEELVRGSAKQLAESGRTWCAARAILGEPGSVDRLQNYHSQAKSPDPCHVADLLFRDSSCWERVQRQEAEAVHETQRADQKRADTLDRLAALIAEAQQLDIDGAIQRVKDMRTGQEMDVRERSEALNSIRPSTDWAALRPAYGETLDRMTNEEKKAAYKGLLQRQAVDRAVAVLRASQDLAREDAPRELLEAVENRKQILVQQGRTEELARSAQAAAAAKEKVSSTVQEITASRQLRQEQLDACRGRKQEALLRHEDVRRELKMHLEALLAIDRRYLDTYLEHEALRQQQADLEGSVEANRADLERALDAEPAATAACDTWRGTAAAGVRLVEERVKEAEAQTTERAEPLARAVAVSRRLAVAWQQKLSDDLAEDRDALHAEQQELEQRRSELEQEAMAEDPERDLADVYFEINQCDAKLMEHRAALQVLSEKQQELQGARSDAEDRFMELIELDGFGPSIPVGEVVAEAETAATETYLKCPLLKKPKSGRRCARSASAGQLAVLPVEAQEQVKLLATEMFQRWVDQQRALDYLRRCHGSATPSEAGSSFHMVNQEEVSGQPSA